MCRTPRRSFAVCLIMATATIPARRPSAGAVPGRWGACLAVRTPPAAFCDPPSRRRAQPDLVASAPAHTSGTFSTLGEGCKHVVGGRQHIGIRDAARRDVDAAADSSAGAAVVGRDADRGAVVNDPAGLDLEPRRGGGDRPAVERAAAQAVAAQEADGRDVHERTMAEVPIREGGPQTVPLAVAALAVAAFRRGDDSAEEAVGLVIEPRGEVEGAGQAPVAAGAEGQIPQAVGILE